jgi:leucyl-tRNA synthetase
VTVDIEDRFHFNTAVSAVMELVNDVNQFLNSEEKKDHMAWSVVKEAVEATVVLLSPVVPHITEELWQMLGHNTPLIKVSWPVYNEAALQADMRTVVLQVNGKLRNRIDVPSSLDEAAIKEAALTDERVRHFVGGKEIKKVIVVQKKLVNVVV